MFQGLVHRARVMQKMHADSLAELVIMAQALRLPPCSSSIFSSSNNPGIGPRSNCIYPLLI
jgi:hypothetical protein